MPRSASARNKESIKIEKSFTESLRDAILPIELPDIVTFAESEHFCNKKLYPRQRTLLRLMFLETENMTDYDKEVIEEWRNNFYVGQERIGVPPDIWKRVEWCKANGYNHFREIEFIGGRRGGKGHLGGIIGAYQAYKMISLDSPQWHYGVDPNKDLYLFVTATNLSQARDYQYKDIAETISNAPCFEKYLATNKGLSLTLRTPADIRKIAELERRNVPMEREIASVRIVALSSNSRSGRGAATFALFFDEMAHMMSQTEGPNTAEEVYKALTPSLDQMGKEGLIYIPTSPYCMIPGTRVLNESLEWVPVETLAVGDKLVGFDEFQVQGNGRCWRKSTVTETSIIKAPTFTVTTTGPSVTCTGEHLWLVKRSGETGLNWVKTSELKPGDRIPDIGTWETDYSREAGYLAGFFDGEGHVSGYSVGACQNPGPVLDYVQTWADKLGFELTEYPKRSSDDTINLRIAGGLAEQMRFLGSIRPMRLMDGFVDLIEGRRTYGKHSKTVEVLSIEEAGVQEVVALGTSTNTLMAEGLFSHNTKVGQAYNIYTQGITANESGEPLVPNLLVVQMPSWEPYKDWDNPLVVKPGTYRGAPQVYDEEVRKLEERDPDSFKVERRAQWSEVINSYLNPTIVEKMFEPIKLLDGEKRVLQNHTTGVGRWIYRGHADPGVSQANFAMAIAHTEQFFDEESGQHLSHVIFDYLQVWKPEDFPDHQVDYLAIEEQLVDIITKFPTLKTFSFDQYGGFVTVPYLKTHLRKRGHSARVRQATFTPKTNQIRAERFKSALGMGWVHAPRDTYAYDNLSLLEQELKFLQLKNGKVVKQEIGPVTTKDLADCVMEVTSELLADQIDRKEGRAALSGTRLAFGGQGGYHTGGTGGRDRLQKYGETKSTNTYGVNFKNR